MTLLYSFSFTTMMTEVWCLLFNNENFHPENVKAVDLVDWQCKEPTLLPTQPKKVLQQCLSEIDFLDEEQVVELVSGSKVASLGLGEDEVLLVQVPGAISNQLRSLAATNLGCKKQKLEGESPSTNFIKGENRNFLTV